MLFKPIGQVAGEFANLRSVGCLCNRLRAGVGQSAVGDVVRDRAVKQRRVLLHQRYLLAQATQGIEVYALAVQGDLVFAHVKNRGVWLENVDLPMPDRPTSATVLPAGMRKLMFFRAGPWA
jgi:hypothetical protein